MLITLTFGDEQVIDKLQSSAKAEKLCWASELPREGLGAQVLEQIKEIKSRDKHWQRCCSGAV
jgi:sphinganine-1-phosphate aldolase